MKLTIELSQEMVQVLKVIDREGRAERALLELVDRVADGVRRPGSWERPWLEQAFGSDWTERLEPDPSAKWRQRPREER